jgi:hypothetical protein
MKEIFITLVSLIKELPGFIEEYLYDSVTNLQVNDIKSTSLCDNEIWLI